MSWADVFSASVTLFFIMDPFGNMPIFHSILKKFDFKERQRIIIRELMIALVILALFLYGGTSFLGFLGLEQASLNIAGGILLFLIAIKMVFPPPRIQEEEADEDPFIVPLAMPLVAGPSAIAVLILLSSSQPDKMLEWSFALLIAWLLSTVILLFSGTVLKFLGSRGSKALERLMGLLLILIAVQMFLDGFRNYLTELGVL